MHPWTALLLSAAAAAASAASAASAARALDSPRERGLYVEDAPASPALNGSQVQCSELPGNFTSAGGAEKNNETQAAIKICDAPSLQTSPTNNSAPTSSQSKIVINTDGTPKVRNISKDIVRPHPTPVHQSRDNTSSQANTTNTSKFSKSLQSNSGNQEKEGSVEPQIFPAKLPNDDAFSVRSQLHLIKYINHFKLSNSTNTDTEQHTPHTVPKQNASVATNRRKESTKISVNATPSSSGNRTGSLNPSKPTLKSNTNHETNATRTADHVIKLLSSDNDSNIGTYSWHVVRAPSPAMFFQVGRNTEDDHDDLKVNYRENRTLMFPKHVEEERSTHQIVPYNETVI